MATIEGDLKEQKKPFSKKVGLFVGTVITINPTLEEYKDILGFEAKNKESVEYLGKTEDGDNKLRIDVWLQEAKEKSKFKLVFYLEDNIKKSKDGTKTQYINTSCACTYANEEENLPSWFTKVEYREAHNGEEEFYSFLRTWFDNLAWNSEKNPVKIQFDWKTLMKGNVQDLKIEIGSKMSADILALATVKLSEKDGNLRQFQHVFNKAFLPADTIKYFKLKDYEDDKVREEIVKSETKNLSFSDKFVKKVCGKYGCKEEYVLVDMKDYVPKNILLTNKTISHSDDSMF